MELDDRIAALTGEITTLAGEVKSKADMPKDRLDAIETEITRLDGELETVLAEKRQRDIESRLGKLETRVTAPMVGAKAAAIMAGAGVPAKSLGKYDVETNWLAALVDRKNGDPEAQAFVKGVLGTSDATGQAIIPNNFVAQLVEAIAPQNPFRSLINVVSGIRSVGVDIPFEVTAISQALLQGAYGSNKDIRDFAFDQATATMYSISQIADIGNQLLRQSGGAAETIARRRLAKSIGRAESKFICTGSGSGQPLGFLTAFSNFGNVAALTYALSSETRASALGNGLAKLEVIGNSATGIVMHPTDFWEMTTETLGTSGSGGWAMDPVGGAEVPRVSVWGVPVFRCVDVTVGTAILGDWTVAEMYLGNEFRIDVSSEGGNRFDQNVTGFRAEEDFGFNATPYVNAGYFVKVTGL